MSGSYSPALNLSTPAPAPAMANPSTVVNNYTSGKTGSTLIAFIVTFIVVWGGLYLIKPTWVQNKNASGEPDGTVSLGMTMFYALIVAIIIALLVWLWRKD